MDGFLALEWLSRLTSRVSEAAPWYAVFLQYAEQAVRLDAEGNRWGAEVIYHQCKLYLEQRAAGEQRGAEPPGLGVALGWVYVGLANLYRFSFRDHWKATEYLRLLLSTRRKIASSAGVVAPSLNEIRFALCLTVFEWVHVSVEGRKSSIASRQAALAVLLEEVRGVLDGLKAYNDAQVMVFLADTLSEGYARLAGHERESYNWKQRSFDWMMESRGSFSTTGDLFLDSLSGGSFVGCEDSKVETCLSRFKELGVKAKTATTAGSILAAVERYMECEAAVDEAGDHLVESKKALLKLWVHYRLGHIHRFDMENGLPKALDYYCCCLQWLLDIKAHEDQLGLNINFVRYIGVASEYISSRWEDIIRENIPSAFGPDKQLDTRISQIQITIAEVVFEAEYGGEHSVSLDEGTRSQCVAAAVPRVRQLLPHLLDEQCSDWFVKDYMCDVISSTYENCGRLWMALFWNEERVKLFDREYRPDFGSESIIPARRFFSLLGDEPSISVGNFKISSTLGIMANRRMDLCLRSADLLQFLGEHEKAGNKFSTYTRQLKGVLGKPESTETARLTSLSYLPSVTSSRRSMQHHSHFRLNPESTQSSISTDAIEAEEAAERKWREDYLQHGPPHDVRYRITRAVMNQDDLSLEANQLWAGGKNMEAVARYKACVELFSDVNAGQSVAGWLFRIGLCHYQLLVSELGAGEHSDAFHFDQALKFITKAINAAEQMGDVYRLADYYKQLGLLYHAKWAYALCGLVKVSVDGLECVLQAVEFYKSSGRNFCRYLYALRKDPDELWVSVLEAQYDTANLRLTTSIYSLIIASIWDAYRLDHHMIVAKMKAANKANQEAPFVNPENQAQLMDLENQFLERKKTCFIEALLWAERGHSRTLAFKLSERNQGSCTRSELQKFDMDDWREAWPGIVESRDACGPGTVMVEFVMAEKLHPQPGAKFFIFCVTQNPSVDGWLLQFKPIEDLETLIGKLKDHMKMGSALRDKDLLQILEDLYEGFFSPLQNILDSMQEHHTLVICANKILASVPFSALRNPVSKKFLVERHTVVCTPSLRILKQCDRRLKALQRTPLMESTGAALVLGDPAFSRAADRLDATEPEADTIAGILGHQNVQLLKGKQALKAEVVKWAQLATTSKKHQAVIHLATHGRVDPNARAFKEGALEFADPKVQTWPPVLPAQPTGPAQHGYGMTSNLGVHGPSTSSASSVEPLQAQEPAAHGRGAPASRAGDSRHLTSGEIVKHNEWRMLLAVLSACETAKGEVKSEGTFSLARALLISGVPSIVVSLWKVDDASAPILMEGLYKAMMSGNVDVASALCGAMRAMIRDGYHVRQWAPFIVMGLGTVELPKQFRKRASAQTKQ